MKNAKHIILSFLIAFGNSLILLPDNSWAKGIIQSTPENYRSIIATMSHSKPIAVHMSSTDKSCRFCERNNKRFIKAASRHQDKFIFIQVNFNPWKSLKKHKRLRQHYQTIKMPLLGLPTVYIYYKGYATSHYIGELKKLEQTLVKGHQKALSLMDTKEKGAAIRQITTSEFSDFLKKSSNPQLIHLTSKDKSCMHCTKSNQFISLAAKKLRGKFDFAEIVYNPWETIRYDLPFLSLLHKKGVRVQGLPTTLVFQNGKIKWYVAGVNPNISEHLFKILPNLQVTTEKQNEPK